MKNKFLYIKNKEVKKSLSCKTIELPIYHCQVKLLFKKNSLKLEKDWNKNRENCGAVTRNFLKDDGSISISFFDNKPKMEDVVHEFHHATAMIMDYIGHDLNKEADEPAAYLMGYLIREYLKIK